MPDHFLLSPAAVPICVPPFRGSPLHPFLTHACVPVCFGDHGDIATCVNASYLWCLMCVVSLGLRLGHGVPSRVVCACGRAVDRGKGEGHMSL